MNEPYSVIQEKDSPRSYRLRRLFKSSSPSIVDAPLTPTSPEGKKGLFMVNNALEKLHGCEIVTPPDDSSATSLGFSPSNKETVRQPHHYQQEDHRPTSTTSSCYSTQSLGKVSVRESYCVVCDFPLVYTLTNEHTIDLECGHRVHQECYSNMALHAVSGNQCSHGKILKHNIKPNKDRDDTALGIADQQPVAPVLHNVLSLEPAFSPSGTNCSKFSSYSTSSSEAVNVKEHQPIKAKIELAYEFISMDTRKLLCLAKLEVPACSESDYDYRSSAADINYGRTFTEELSSLSFHGQLLASVPKGKLRLLDTLFITSRNSTWMCCYVYLFSKLMVICRVDGQENQTVQYILNVKDIEQVRLEDLDKGKVLCLITLSKSLPELFLSTEDVCVLYKWRLALYNPEYEFPLAPRSREDREYIQSQLLIREPQVPLDLVFCISLSDVADSAKTRRIVQAIQKLHSTMSSFDRLGIIFFGYSLLKSFPLRRKACGNWDAITEELVSLTSSKIQSTFDYTDLLACCESLLYSYCSTLSFASVIIVSDLKNASFSYVPWTFVKAGTPINTFDISTSNPNLLSSISTKTGGRYVLLENVNGLVGPMEEILKFEKMYRMKNNVVILEPSHEVQIHKVTSVGLKFGRVPMRRSTDIKLLSDIGRSNSQTETIQLELGNLNAGQAHTLCVELSLNGSVDKLQTTKALSQGGNATTSANSTTGDPRSILQLFNMRWDANKILSLGPTCDYSTMTSVSVGIARSHECVSSINTEVLYCKVCLEVADLLSGFALSTPSDNRVDVFGAIDLYLRDTEAILPPSSSALSALSRKSNRKYYAALTSLIMATRETIRLYRERLASPDRAGQLASVITDTTWCLRTRRSYTTLTPLHTHFLVAKLH